MLIERLIPTPRNPTILRMRDPETLTMRATVIGGQRHADDYQSPRRFSPRQSQLPPTVLTRMPDVKGLCLLRR
jgi:hypothetical protein